MTLKAKFRKSRANEGGQALVEFALVFLFIFIVFISALQVILLMYGYTTLANAAKEGVRFAVVHGTGFGASCSGPGDPSATPPITCGDASGQAVIGDVSFFTGLSFQAVASGRNGCSGGVGINVCYDPNGANSNSSFGGACSAPGCLVRVTVSHTYRPLFGLGWPTFTLNAAADGRIMN
jgi:TadE-like protein